VHCSLYIHIPFCVRKCSYCDFTSYAATGISIPEYVELLLNELAANAEKFSRPAVSTLYFGGGTPSLLSPGQVERLLAAVSNSYSVAADAEVTLEANPGTISRESLDGYLAAGINRLSLGIQSFDDAQLQLLGRIHTAADARQAYAMARQAGFRNISIDLMHSLPQQSVAAWQAALTEAVSMNPEHISAYGLTVESGTPFAARAAQGSLQLPAEDLAVELFEITAAELRQAGYEHYEVSNFARPGFRSRHNQVYWQRGSYLGFGAGAHSFLREPFFGVRWENPACLDAYAERVKTAACMEMPEPLTREEAMAEFFFLGLRQRAGIDLQQFRQEFGVTADDAFPGTITRFIGAGLLSLSGENLQLTARGLLLANMVLAEFMAPS
jgi:oxygen-independent coproporphyrinogen-3 oxidase